MSLEELINKINAANKYADEDSDKVTEEGITNDARLLTSIRDLVTYMLQQSNQNNINQGIVLNLSLSIFRFIRDERIELIHEERMVKRGIVKAIKDTKTCKTRLTIKSDANSGETTFFATKVTNKYRVILKRGFICSAAENVKKEPIIVGRSYREGKLYRETYEYDFTETFGANGLIQSTQLYEVGLSERKAKVLTDIEMLDSNYKKTTKVDISTVDGDIGDKIFASKNKLSNYNKNGLPENLRCPIGGFTDNRNGKYFEVKPSLVEAVFPELYKLVYGSSSQTR